MSYQSVDALQRQLAEDVFHYTTDAKKAAGRALGTLVEIVTFYLLKSWELEQYIAIERHLPEYGNPDITHNVEFSLHPSLNVGTTRFDNSRLPITPRKIARNLKGIDLPPESLKTSQLLTSGKVLRNACVLSEDEENLLVAYLDKSTRTGYRVNVNRLVLHPFAAIECKRVGIEEGISKGPQTIEKAKQGGYVARTLSSLQKIRTADGSVHGVLDVPGGDFHRAPYNDLLDKVIASDDPDLLRHFTLTVGIASNHGNWFTAEDHNKELKVLADSYDWLLFLTDEGLSEFVDSLLVSPKRRYKPIRDAFLNSYPKAQSVNMFTKVQMALNADLALRKFFVENLSRVESWFNVISPEERSVDELKNELRLLAHKNWQDILT